jgi:hypothetical protein
LNRRAIAGRLIASWLRLSLDELAEWHGVTQREALKDRIRATVADAPAGPWLSIEQIATALNCSKHVICTTPLSAAVTRWQIHPAPAPGRVHQELQRAGP